MKSRWILIAGICFMGAVLARGQTLHKQKAERIDATKAALPDLVRDRKSGTVIGNWISGAEVTAVDRSVDPCTDFYRYACGKWLSTNPVPVDYPRWFTATQVFERNLAVLRTILERASVPDPHRDPITQKIGDYYASCMDEATINRKGLQPLLSDLRRIRGIRDKKEMIEVMAMEENRLGITPFSFGAAPDFRNSEMTVANIDQGGLGLPDPDYYLKDDPQMSAVRRAYAEHIKKIFMIAGQKAETASKSADAVMVIETELAKSFMGRAQRRDPHNRDHEMTSSQLEALAPSLHFQRYFTLISAPSFERLNVGNPEFVKALSNLIETVSLDIWQSYMSWHLLSAASMWLPNDFVKENFKFARVLTGQKELQPRWKRCVIADVTDLRGAVGRVFAAEIFNAQDRQRMLQLIEDLKAELRQEIVQISWFSSNTREEALAKLAAMRKKIGFSDQWDDYADVKIVRGSMLANSLRLHDFEGRRHVARIGKPVDREEWSEPVITVDAYYRSAFNELVFPAGILQPPFFDRNADDAANYGAIGAIIGHELTHAFDDQGRKRDATGKLRDWWTAEDAVEFERRASCFVNEYDSFTAIDDLHVNGKLTVGENLADNNGVRIAFMALHKSARRAANSDAAAMNDTALDQQFFLSYARARCENTTPEIARTLARNDTHSPARWRVNGVVQNMPEFQAAFGCKSGQPMVSENVCRVW